MKKLLEIHQCKKKTNNKLVAVQLSFHIKKIPPFGKVTIENVLQLCCNTEFKLHLRKEITENI